MKLIILLIFLINFNYLINADNICLIELAATPYVPASTSQPSTNETSDEATPHQIGFDLSICRIEGKIITNVSKLIN